MLMIVCIVMVDVRMGSDEIDLEYITEDDIRSNKVTVLTHEEQVAQSLQSPGPDADDLLVFRTRPLSPISTKDLNDRGPLASTNYVVGKELPPIQVGSI